jgi:plastocyanin
VHVPESYTITITDDSVDAADVTAGDTIQWTNSASVSVTLSNLPDILSPTPPGATITIAVGQSSSSYTVNGSRGDYTYDISATSPEGLPRTGTIDIG